LWVFTRAITVNNKGWKRVGGKSIGSPKEHFGPDFIWGVRLAHGSQDGVLEATRWEQGTLARYYFVHYTLNSLHWVEITGQITSVSW